MSTSHIQLTLTGSTEALDAKKRAEIANIGIIDDKQTLDPSLRPPMLGGIQGMYIQKIIEDPKVPSCIIASHIPPKAMQLKPAEANVRDRIRDNYILNAPTVNSISATSTTAPPKK